MLLSLTHFTSTVKKKRRGLYRTRISMICPFQLLLKSVSYHLTKGSEWVFFFKENKREEVLMGGKQEFHMKKVILSFSYHLTATSWHGPNRCRAAAAITSTAVEGVVSTYAFIYTDYRWLLCNTYDIDITRVLVCLHTQGAFSYIFTHTGNIDGQVDCYLLF